MQGDKLASLLQKHNLTQVQLADMLKQSGYTITSDAISKYIAGKRKIPTKFIQAILSLLGEKDANIFFNDEAINSISISVFERVNCGKVSKSDETLQELIYMPNYEFKPSIKAVIANGNQMSPIIDDGDIIIYDTDKNIQVTNGDLVVYSFYEEKACKVFVEKPHINIIELKPIEKNENFITTAIRADDKYMMSRLEIYKIVKIYKKLQNKEALLKLIKED